MRLYHFTCRDGAAQIDRCGELRPQPQPLLGGIPLLWLTDLSLPDRAAIGLTSYSLRCDRMERRYVIDAANIWHWSAFLLTQPTSIRRAARQLLAAEGVRPMHWWVSTEPIPVAS